MSALARIWLAIYQDGLSPLETLDRLRNELISLAPRPGQMRRLKRSLFRLPRAALERVMAPRFVLRAVTSDQIASTLAPDDASIVGWATIAWNESAGDVLDAYVAALPRDNDIRRSVTHASAADVARDRLREAIIDTAAPRDLQEIATRAPALLLPILTDRVDEAWWLAWASLPDAVISNSLIAARGEDPQITSQIVERVCSALIAPDFPSRRSHEVWELLAAQDGRLALHGLLATLASRPEKLNDWRQVVTRHVDLVVATLDAGPRTELLAMLAELAPPDLALISRGARPWLRLAQREQLSKLRRGLGLLMLLGLNDQSPDPAFISLVYAHLYQRLADGDGTDEWRLVEAELPGSSSDWDRCGRLAEGVARKIAQRSKRARNKAVHLAAAEYSPAGERLENELRRRAWFPFFMDLRSSD